MKPQTVFIPVDVNDRLPNNKSEVVFSISPDFGDSCRYAFDLNDGDSWLEKKESVFVLTMDELREMWDDAINEGASRENTGESAITFFDYLKMDHHK